MKRSLCALIAIAALVWTGSALADAHEEAGKTEKARAEKSQEKGKKHKADAQERAREATDEADDARDEAEDAAEEAAEAGEEAGGEAKDAAGGAAKADRDVPPGMAKRDAHPSTGKGSEQGQEARAKQEKPWWNFWD